MSILVFGSINMDLVVQTPRLPQPGETVTGYNFLSVAGGKGANQAVAAARLGAKTDIVGRVGGDAFAEELLEELKGNRVGCKGVLRDNTTHSGLATIAVDNHGENQIIIIPGANGSVGHEDVQRLQPLWEEATSLLLQLEIPLKAVEAAIHAAHNAGVRVILDPAPAPDVFPQQLYPLVDIITPNETEASQLVGFPVNNVETAQKAADTLLSFGVKTAVIKLGSKGVFWATKSESFLVPAFAVNAVDTVAAGDAFNGGMAAALDEGRSLKEAILWGAATGALSTTQVGAQSSLPDRQALDNVLMPPMSTLTIN
ncbi:ribokinase [Arthrospira platensis]|jgi:ribokinase|uniref:Ribokinase n=1 Tax=Limnospira platensis NIES-46 TaxID=1236695 RepID=A0A5M3TF65_LIMPL|nr:ribokinase [Arthrospira platensis]AMW30822.1 ribokinase [Arthrospira platensis YZ]KDR55210.1 ribokinase [Arthrospira platensis str. Paraca]MBD2670142.1 ribokinase [Arthrospira platensis FACHB-439]MBD2710633.1 ribokinase [Arthrospira platensis FACHB-835]MDF2208151.1 ribokinase [Arthrospira platensis NCB002]MDT9184303.1 ribokinase [Limnospira sp. PMC 289.06]MDT9295284.1 ribokinase [Arthrospira platensis PCC 7345]MDT9310939.1 ribokinase [Limnospira sp. Paracas R14]QQW28737.1 ribokinase [Ar